MATKDKKRPEELDAVNESVNTKERRDALKTAIENVEKKFGKGSVMRLGDSPRKEIPHFSSGVPSLDFALGIGGYPRGRVIEIYGPEAGGKTTMSLLAIAEVQRMGGTALFIDAEHALDIEYAARLGVDVNNLLLVQPSCGEDALQTAEEFTASSAVDIIVIDSVAALVPRAEVDGEMGDSSMGVQARLMSQALRKLTAIVAKSHTTLIFINQLRMKIGVMFGNPETTTGGNALKFYASIRLDVRKVEAIKEGDVILGSKTRVKVVKNKVAPPFRQTIFNLIFGEGIDIYADIIDLAVAHNIIVKSGSWYSFGDSRLGQGIEAVSALLRKDNILYEDIRQRVLALLKPAPLPVKESTNV